MPDLLTEESDADDVGGASEPGMFYLIFRSRVLA